jgi:hypothetical protein
MFLTTAEIVTLTGYQRHADQRRWLTERAWIFETAATGRPVVTRSYAESRLGAAAVQAAPPVSAWTPNVACIRKAA